MPWAPVSESYSLTEIKLHGNQGALSNASSCYTRSGLYEGYFTKALFQEEGSGKQTIIAQLHTVPLYSGKITTLGKASSEKWQRFVSLWHMKPNCLQQDAHMAEQNGLHSAYSITEK